ncbi:MAG: hypothetical protein A3I09_00280 [Deltaproteobacteria bacterium RIFCSPLOWO2_02_FULL_47_10]|nr:MAG: hypothetical protein A3I09_00280 [Deltaproteobacteria bacterium RIFCSPLOWO2_02_FULL_47_10]
MNLRIITSEREELNTESESILLPGELGQMEILPGHAKMVSLLSGGEIFYLQNGEKGKFTVSGGLVEVADDKVCALVT